MTPPAAPRKPPARKKPPAPGRRRSFSQRTLALRHHGPHGEVLARALEVPSGGGYVLTHRFHPYPGRFHPHLAAVLLETFAEAQTAGARKPVCDPFMGGGTTLVEAMLRGRTSIGNDLNPVALLVARERTRPRDPKQAGQVTGSARRIAAQVEALRREKHPPRAVLPQFPVLAPHYQPHLLAELVQWHRLIEGEGRPPVKDTLRAVFSAGVVKFSNRTSDAKAGTAPPRYPKGAVSRFLVAKTEELVRAQLTLAQRLPSPRRVTLLQEDARLMPSLDWGSVGLVVTSPPYPGTYDYAGQHALRMAWLGLEPGAFVEGEVGSRREGGAGWGNVMRDVMSTLARVLTPEGPLLMVMGDWIEDGHAVDAAAALEKAGLAKGWRIASAASVRRDVHSHLEKKAFAKRGKWEHLLHFTRGGTVAAPPGREAPPKPKRGNRG